VALAGAVLSNVRTLELPKNEQSWTLRNYTALVSDCDVAVVHSISNSLLRMADPTMLPSAWIATGARWRDHPEEREALAREWLLHHGEAATLPRALTAVDALDTANLAMEPAPFDTWPPGRDFVIV
jgi:hypothetical protein